MLMYVVRWKINSIGDAKYFFIFENDFSRTGFVYYFLEGKNQVFVCYKSFKVFVVNKN